MNVVFGDFNAQSQQYFLGTIALKVANVLDVRSKSGENINSDYHLAVG